MVGTPYTICRQVHLDVVDAKAKTDGVSLNIYTIGVRPKLSIDPDSVVISKGRIRGCFRAQKQNGFVSFSWDEPNPFGTENVKFETKYPYSEFSLIGPKGRVIGGDVGAVLAGMHGTDISDNPNPLLDIEVLYVGQSYGEAGERSALTRLRSHETLQDIYANIHERMPEKDVWLIPWIFNEAQYQTISFGGLAEGGDGPEDMEHVEKVQANPVSYRQKINFTEAAMIRYFQPPYNTTFKNQFPNHEHKSYSECYAVDLNLVAVELQTWFVATRLYSEKIQPGLYHVASFPLHSAEERANMFDFSNTGAGVRNGPIF
ncbi:conserved uncharacterized protein [Stigmatella aurantiaca DW4/3-1]|uniref:Conserved uncharacterized protein n=2 Tax=Stigmatella aurantiaca TaxID=41 RepID=E3FZM9_STIAD|nr:conserved uncharacterized protein [Stigmatella aurantiaca DW4/3-1]